MGADMTRLSLIASMIFAFSTPAMATNFDFTAGTPIYGTGSGLNDRTNNGFTWNNPLDGTYYSGCATRGRGLYSSDGMGFYGLDDCGYSYSVERADGAAFSVSSFTGYARDWRNWTRSDPEPDINDFVDAFGYTDYVAYDRALYDWADDGIEPADAGQFEVVGYLDGVRVTTFEYSAMSQSTLALVGFDEVDRIVFTQSIGGFNFVDDLLKYPSTSSTAHCYANCYSFGISSMTVGAPITGPGGGNPAAVPLTASLPMLLGGLGGFAALRRRRG